MENSTYEHGYFSGGLPRCIDLDVDSATAHAISSEVAEHMRNYTIVDSQKFAFGQCSSKLYYGSINFKDEEHA